MKLKIPFLVLSALALSGFASDTGPDDFRSDISITLTYDLPIPLDDNDVDESESFTISENGVLTFQGKDILPSEISGIASNLKLDETHRISVSAHRNARFSDVILRTYEISRSHKFGFSGLKAHKKFAHKAGDQPESILPAFQGELGEFELPVVIGHSENGQNCIVALNGESVGPYELYDLSFKWLESIVIRMGGIEAIMEKPGVVEAIEARFQVPADTPWHCVAGTMHNVQKSGWPTVKFELMD